MASFPRIGLQLSMGMTTCLVSLHTLTATAQSDALAALLQKAGERVEFYFTRAQSLVCLEVVRLMPLSSTWGSEGMGRTVESELRLSWSPDPAGGPASEAQTLRQLVRVNGRQPREKDSNNCTTPEQTDEEPQALSMLLPQRRAEYRFTLGRESKVDGRVAIQVDYTLLKKVSVESKMVEGRDDCVSFDVKGGRRGRLWIDLETYDVLRLDEQLIGLVDVPLPRQASRGPGRATSWTIERMDTSIRFKPVTFSNPDETLVLPVEMSSLQIIRGAGTPRLRTVTDYTKYQRFLTTGRVIGP